MKTILPFIILSLISVSQAGNPGDEFRANFIGKKSDKKWLEKKAELKMARNVQYCRGTFMPKKNSSWSCNDISKKQIECNAKFVCGRVHQNFNRYSETKRILTGMRGVPTARGSYTIWTGDMPVNMYDKYRTANEVNQLIKSSRKPASTYVSPENVVVVDDLSDLAQVESKTTKEEEVEVISGDPEVNMKAEEVNMKEEVYDE